MNIFSTPVNKGEMQSSNKRKLCVEICIPRKSWTLVLELEEEQQASTGLVIAYTPWINILKSEKMVEILQVAFSDAFSWVQKLCDDQSFNEFGSQ